MVHHILCASTTSCPTFNSAIYFFATWMNTQFICSAKPTFEVPRRYIYSVQSKVPLTVKWHRVCANCLLIPNLPLRSHTVPVHAYMHASSSAGVPLRFLLTFTDILFHCVTFAWKRAERSASGFVWHLQLVRPHRETRWGQLSRVQGDAVLCNQWSRTACCTFLNPSWPTSQGHPVFVCPVRGLSLYLDVLICH